MMAVFNKLNVAKVMFLATLTTWAVTEIPLEECREKAAAGDAEAQYQLGQRYEEGRGLSRNGIRAVIQYKKAAEQKHRKACIRLSELYSHGEFVKKDPVIAAKYRALASGDNAEIAVAKASEEERKSTETVDDIEVALDWILGRNGKRKDPKIGIRMLCDAAKDRPIAKGVFIRRWMKGDLDDALEVLTNEEWTLIESWFEYERIKDPHSYARGRIDYGVVVKRTQRAKSELEAKHKSLLKEEKRYLQYIKQAADMGCEPAQKAFPVTEAKSLNLVGFPFATCTNCHFPTSKRSALREQDASCRGQRRIMAALHNIDAAM